MKIKHTRNYTAARQVDYPPVGEQLDAIFKLAEQLAQSGTDLPPATAEWVEKCRAVKARYPKPE